MNEHVNSGNWRRPSLVAALATFGVLVALPAVPAAAHAQQHESGKVVCELGGAVNYNRSCAFDTNGDGVEDWWVSDTDADAVYDTSTLDTDFDGQAETFYFSNPYGGTSVRYDHDGDWLYDDEETWLYYTDPYRWDTDGDGYGDHMEIAEGSSPFDPYCTPYGCG
jgi:hypothetical protein